MEKETPPRCPYCFTHATSDVRGRCIWCIRKLVPRGKIKLYIGPMWGGKTSKLISKYISESESFGVKPDLDTRGAASMITSHDGLTIPARRFKTLSEIFDPKTMTVSTDCVLYRCPPPSGIRQILIDEGQFFPDLAQVVDLLADLGYNMYIAALNGRSDQTAWDPVSQIIPIAENIIHMHAAKCMRCRKRSAAYTAIKREVENAGVKKGGVLIGAGDIYEPICGVCIGLARRLNEGTCS